MFNIFEKFAKADEATSPDPLSPDEIAAEEKAERIRFHREKVRNGPINFTSFTNGQIRRAKTRAAARDQRKSYRADVKNYFERRSLAALVRAHLQTVGIIQFLDGREAPLRSQVASTIWLARRFGVEVVNDEGVGAGYVSFRSGDLVDAMREAAKFYGTVTGFTPTVAKDFEPAIVLDEDAA